MRSPVPKLASPASVKPELLKLADVAKMLSTSSYKIQCLLAEGAFDVVDFKLKGSTKPAWRITRSSLEKFIERRKIPNTAAFFKVAPSVIAERKKRGTK